MTVTGEFPTLHPRSTAVDLGKMVIPLFKSALLPNPLYGGDVSIPAYGRGAEGRTFLDVRLLGAALLTA
ncbi:hypothetical protein [Adonisia turfae]|uniref:hypothetical protein n=1 Tax=Adonisia turfae TaxID=2950184 RepID=UPI0013CF8E47|nr:hypothetical protein [Adonisia turfae]